MPTIGTGIPVDPGEAGLASVDGFIRERTGKPVDHGALLALAEEMVETFRLGAFTGEGLSAKWCRELYDKYTRRIREALGRVENNVQRSAEGWDDC